MLALPQHQRGHPDALAASERLAQQLVPLAAGLLRLEVIRLFVVGGRDRLGVHEILLRTPGLGGAIRDGKTAMINSIIESGRAQGMQTLDAALMQYVRDDVIDGREAYLKANDKKLFRQWADG